MNAPTKHQTTITTAVFDPYTKEHTAHCTCGWEYTSTSKPDAEWKARMHRLLHVKDTT